MSINRPPLRVIPMPSSTTLAKALGSIARARVGIRSAGMVLSNVENQRAVTAAEEATTTLLRDIVAEFSKLEGL